jgi:hypothetical protein
MTTRPTMKPGLEELILQALVDSTSASHVLVWCRVATTTSPSCFEMRSQAVRGRIAAAPGSRFGRGADDAAWIQTDLWREHIETRHASRVG